MICEFRLERGTPDRAQVGHRPMERLVSGADIAINCCPERDGWTRDRLHSGRVH